MAFKDIVEIGASLIVSLGGGGAIVFGLSNYLGKLWSDRALEKQRQEYAKLNLELTHKLDLVTEQTKLFHQMAALEHQVRFSKLHEARAQVITDLYAQLVDLEYAGKRFVHFGGHERDQPTRDREYSETSAKAMEVFFFFEKHQIYLSESVCTLLKDFVETARKAVNAVHVYGPSNIPTSAEFH